MALVEGDQAPGGVEYVDDAPLPRLGVAHGMGEHRGDAALARPTEHARSDGCGQGAAACAMADDLNAQGVAEDLAPRHDERIGKVGATRGEGLGDR